MKELMREEMDKENRKPGVEEGDDKEQENERGTEEKRVKERDMRKGSAKSTQRENRE